MPRLAGGGASVSATILILAFVAALALHEAGHYLAARLLGFPARIVVRWQGVGTQWGSDERLSSDRERLLVSLAGPFCSIVSGLALCLLGVPGWWVVVVIGAVQLIPLPASDGRNAWSALRRMSA